MPSIDGLRALAILPVMGFHLITNFPSLQHVFYYGWAGVDLFFVISGYLITGILLDSRNSRHYFLNFYARRTLRIWPLYYALLLFMFLIVPFVSHREGLAIFAKSHPWQSYPFFLQNFFVQGLGAGPLGLTWSLAIEEQFYLLWPLLVYFAPKRLLGFILFFFLVGSGLLRLVMLAYGSTPLQIYVNLFCRLDGLSAGAGLALWQRSAWYNWRRERRLVAGALCAGVAGLIAVGFENTVMSYSFLAITFTGAVAICSGKDAPRWLQWKPLTFTGTISYGLYLLHVVAYDVVRETPLGRLGWISPIIMVALAFLLASASWYWFEKPILSLKKHFTV